MATLHSSVYTERDSVISELSVSIDPRRIIHLLKTSSFLEMHYAMFLLPLLKCIFGNQKIIISLKISIHPSSRTQYTETKYF